eukprot:gene12843-biopygen16968
MRTSRWRSRGPGAFLRVHGGARSLPALCPPRPVPRHAFWLPVVAQEHAHSVMWGGMGWGVTQSKDAGSRGPIAMKRATIRTRGHFHAGVAPYPHLGRATRVVRLPHHSAGCEGHAGDPVLFRAAPCCSALFRAVPHRSVLFRTVLCCSALFRAVPCCSMLFRVVPQYSYGAG